MSLLPVAGFERLLSRAGFERLVSAGILAVASVAALALVASSWASWSAVNRAAQVAARGQAEMLMADALRTLLPQTGDIVAATRRFLDEHKAGGARYFALVDQTGQVGQIGSGGTSGVLIAEAGEAPMPREEIQRTLAAEPAGELVPAGRLLMMSTRPPAPVAPGSAAMMKPGLQPLLPGGAPPAEYLGAPRPPEMLLVFEPLVSMQLQAAARRTLALGLAGALALALATAVVLRWLSANVEMARRREHEGRLVVLGEMSAVLAHEIRNPLASLKGHAQLLVEVVQPGRAHEKAERVVREAMRLEGLVNDLLEFVRSGRIERVPTDPAALLKSSADAAGSRMSGVDPARVVVRTAGAPPTFSLDGPRLAQVLINVIRNAQQATPADAPPVEVEVHGDRDTLVFTVHDHGPGVPPGEEERIFEPFHTTRVRGMGLGLAASRRLVALHGGTIRVSNHAEGGAVFRIEIPRE